MDASEAASHVLEAGQSAELVAAFRCVAEATAPEGGPKYPPRVCQALARAIVCRTYATLVLQLCHLVNAADACAPPGASYETLFFAVARATPGAFRGHLAQALAQRAWRRPGFEATDEGIAIRYSDAPFNVPFARMPVLAALFEFLLTIDDYPEIDAVLGDMLGEPSATAAVAEAARRLEGRLYRTLGEHLPSAQNNRKFHRILGFLKERAEGGAIEIDDEGIVVFWRRNSADTEDEGVDFRMFRTVLGAFINFVRALETARTRRGVDGAAPIGGDREAGELDPGDFAEAAIEAAEWRSPFASRRGTGEPHQVPQQARARGPEPGHRLRAAARRLPMSVLRAEVFGQIQGRITQALRNKSVAREVRSLIEAADADYGSCEAGFAKLREHVQRVLQAATHVLLSEPAPHEGNVVAIGATDPTALFERMCRESEAIDGARLAEALERAKRSFRGFARKGFEEDAAGTPEIIEGFRAGVVVLQSIERELGAYLATLGEVAEGQGLGGRCERDRELFREQFLCIYGEAA